MEGRNQGLFSPNQGTFFDFKKGQGRHSPSPLVPSCAPGLVKKIYNFIVILIINLLGEGKLFFCCMGPRDPILIHGIGDKLVSNWEQNMLYTKFSVERYLC